VKNKMLGPRTKFSILGFVLGLGSPVGWIFLRFCFETPADTLAWCAQELNQHRLLYLYITVGTILSFSLFGYFLGHLIQKIMEKDKLLEAKTRDYMRILGFVAHELKNPLTLVKGNLDVALGTTYGPLNPKLEGALKIAQSASEQINQMISSYLNLSRIERGELNLKFKTVDVLKNVIYPVVDEMEGYLSEHGMRILDDMKSDRKCLVAGDAEWLKVVFRNLLSNAIRYGYKDTPIKLSLSEQKNEWQFEVYNEGYGIPNGHKEKVFEKFEKVPRDGKLSGVGTGLGLYIVKDIIEQHGGKIRCESEPNQWANFILTLPKEIRE
jgi:signal transduction histidine kinase